MFTLDAAVSGMEMLRDTRDGKYLDTFDAGLMDLKCRRPCPVHACRIA
jgi:hypothetical protein